MAEERQRTIVVGAGPVGALAALYAAARGDQVYVYELRGGTYPFCKFDKPPEDAITASQRCSQPQALQHHSYASGAVPMPRSLRACLYLATGALYCPPNSGFAVLRPKDVVSQGRRIALGIVC